MSSIEMDPRLLALLLHYTRTVSYFLLALFLFSLATHMRRVRYLPGVLGMYFSFAGIAAFFVSIGHLDARDQMLTFVITPAVVLATVVTARALWYVAHNP